MTLHKLIISEKPSVAASIAYCIGATEKISEGNTFYWQGNGYIVTNALGHLFGIGMPDDYGFEKWDMIDAQTLKTAFHETAHNLLHDPKKKNRYRKISAK